MSGQTGTSFVMTCGRYNNSCRDGTIFCAQGMDCEVDCHHKDKGSWDEANKACFGMNIYGPTDYKLRVECECLSRHMLRIPDFKFSFCVRLYLC